MYLSLLVFLALLLSNTVGWNLYIANVDEEALRSRSFELKKQQLEKSHRVDHELGSDKLNSFYIGTKLSTLYTRNPA